MHALDLISQIIRAVGLIAGLLLPGAMIMRALGLPRTPATCFAGSAVALYTIVLGFALAGVPISGLSLTAGLAVVALVGGWFGRRNAATVTSELHALASPWHAPLTKMGPWTSLYLAFVVIALLRLWANPLAGADIEFRWSYLAEQMLRLASLDFYPPHSSADFMNYFWAESIPPGGVGAARVGLCVRRLDHHGVAAPATALQFWSLHELLWQIADRTAGIRAARFACLCAAACPLLTWAVLLGQETGLTTLSLVGIRVVAAQLDAHACAGLGRGRRIVRNARRGGARIRSRVFRCWPAPACCSRAPIGARGSRLPRLPRSA